MAQERKGSKRQAKNEGQGTRTVKRGSQTTQTTTKGEPETGIAPREQTSPITTISPFSFMRRFSEEMDKLYGDLDFGRRFASGLGGEIARLADLEGSLWAPQVETFERDGKLIIRADLPGLTKDDINVDITDDAIKIRGERRQEREENKDGYYRSERSYGTFYREIPLPGRVNREEANATFRDGVLEITMPAPARQPGSQRLEISDGAGTEQQPKAMSKAAGR